MMASHYACAACPFTTSSLQALIRHKKVNTVPTTDWIQWLLDDYVTLGQAVQVCGVSRTTMWKWVRAGKMPVIRVGREVLIEKGVLDEIKKTEWSRAWTRGKLREKEEQAK